MKSFRPSASFRLGAWGWSLLAFGLALRLSYSAYVLFTGISGANNDEYETIAINLVDHGRFDGVAGKSIPTAAREPGFPFFIASLYLLFGKHPYLVLAAQSLLNVGACVLLALCARRLAGELAARIALGLGLFYPYFIFYTGYFYRETILTAAVAAVIYLSGSLFRKPSAPLAGLAGFMLGFCAVTMSTFLLIDALMAPYYLWRLWKAGGRIASLSCFCMGLAVLPSAWIGRNYAVFHRFIPGSTLGGYNLYTVLIVPEEWRGTSREYEFETADPLWPRILAMNSLMTDDGRQQEAFLAAARDHIKRNPRRFATHMIKGAVKLWRFYPYERRYQHSYALIKILSLLSDGWLIPLGLWGLWRLRRRGPEPVFFALLLGAGTLTYSLVAAIMRYRLPFMAPILVGCSCALAVLLGPRLGIASEPEIGFH